VAFSQRNPDAKVIVLSGDSQNAEDWANEHDFGWFPKPAALWKISEWFLGNDQILGKGEHKLRKSHQVFAVEGRYKKVISKATELLTKICKDHKFSGAVWVLRMEAGTYEVRAITDDIKDDFNPILLAQLANSAVETAINDTSISSFRLPPSDPIVQEIPDIGRYVCAVPLHLDVQTPRCVMFFSRGRIADKSQKYIEDRIDHFNLLIDGIQQAEAVEEISVSAQLGRLALASLHELRTEVQKISLAIENSKDDKETLATIEHDYLPDAIELTAGELSRFQSNGASRQQLSDVLERVVRKMKRYFLDKHPSKLISIFVDIDDRIEDVYISQPTALERIIINLLDNAADFMRAVPEAQIEVKVNYNFYGGNLPIEICVRDTGMGLNLVDMSRIFLPRRSFRSNPSTGLGLYIVKELVEMLEGEVQAIQKPLWTGAEFKIRLPETVG